MPSAGPSHAPTPVCAVEDATALIAAALSDACTRGSTICEQAPDLTLPSGFKVIPTSVYFLLFVKQKKCLQIFSPSSGAILTICIRHDFFHGSQRKFYQIHENQRKISSLDEKCSKFTPAAG